MIRLTANMSAGHIVILAFSSLIFIFSQGGEAVAAGTGVGIFSTLFMIFMYFLELLVAFLQAFVFTLLAAIYFGEATHEPAHH
jgi:F-type H+-transporting ATPase subunit a